MRIIVFVKQVMFIYAQTGTDAKQCFVGPYDIVQIPNPFDELAVEEALRIKERLGGIEIVAISLGDSSAEEGLRKCLAMGAERAIHIFTEGCERMDAWSTATVLAHSIRNLPFDLVLCGKESIDDQGGLAGPYIAEILKIPFVSRVIKLDVDRENQKVFLHRSVERGNRETMECTMPALFTVERGINIPRYPTLPGILKAQKQKIERLEFARMGLPTDPFDSNSMLTEMIGVSLPKPRKRSRGAEEAKLSASDRLKLMMKGGAAKKKEDTKIFEGGSDRGLDEVERVLKENGIV